MASLAVTVFLPSRGGQLGRAVRAFYGCLALTLSPHPQARAARHTKAACTPPLNKQRCFMSKYLATFDKSPRF